MSTRPILGSEFGLKVCEALGIATDRVVRVSLDLTCDGAAATVKVWRWVSEDEMGALVQMLNDYTVVEEAI